MLYNDVVQAALDLCGEPTGVIGSGRWTELEIRRAVNRSVGYVYDVMNEAADIETFNTVASDNLYDLSSSIRSVSQVLIDGIQIIKVGPETLPKSTEKGVPRQCAIYSSGSTAGGYTLELWPTPADVYGVQVVNSGFAKLIPGSTIPLPDSMEDVIIYGTAAYMCKKLVVNKNNNSREFELERNKALNQVTLVNSNTELSSMWPHG